MAKNLRLGIRVLVTVNDVVVNSQSTALQAASSLTNVNSGIDPAAIVIEDAADRYSRQPFTVDLEGSGACRYRRQDPGGYCGGYPEGPEG